MGSNNSKNKQQKRQKTEKAVEFTYAQAEGKPHCYFPTEFLSVPLLSKSEYNHDTTKFEFGLPDGTSLNLPTCACMLLKAPGAGEDGADVVRPYTPISNNEMLGKFQLLVKVYEQGAASQYLHNAKIGQEVAFKHIEFNIKVQYPFNKKTISMLAVGTGITPMYQALHYLVNNADDETKVVLLYGNKSEKDILLKAELDKLAESSQFDVKYIVGTSKDEIVEGWHDEEKGQLSGWVDAEKIEKYCFPSSSETSVFVCGLPMFYDVLCGPRGDKEVKTGTILADLGYSAENVVKF